MSESVVFKGVYPIGDTDTIELTIDGKKVLQTIYPKSKVATFTVPIKGKLTGIAFDPNETLLKEVAK